MAQKMTLGGLFSGVGGFELAATWAGIEPVWSNEIDPFCCEVLRKNFKHEIIEGDIRNIGSHNLKAVDIICGGFPCQPFSVAGKRKGKEDDRYLWPEMLRVIREVKPSWVVGENVAGIVNMELDKVLSDLEDEGYQTEAFIIPACAVNAPHRRDRVWIVAYSYTNGTKRKNGTEKIYDRWFQEGLEEGYEPYTLHEFGVTAHAYNTGLQRCKVNGSTGKFWTEQDQFITGRIQPAWQDFPTVSPVRGRNDGLPSWLVKSSLKAYGNAIVPQIATEIFKAILDYDRHH